MSRSFALGLTVCSWLGEGQEEWKSQLCILIVASSVNCLTTKISFVFWRDWLSLRDDVLNNMDFQVPKPLLHLHSRE